MKAYVISAAIGFASVALAMMFFFAGYFFRGSIEQTRPAIAGAAAVSPITSPVVAPTSSVGTDGQLNVPLAGSVGVGNRPSRGPLDTSVTIQEFSDFQCPFCKTFVDQTLPLVLSTYGDRVRLVYRDFPISSLHPQAAKAAEAAQCAFEQGRFWEYHDRLFQNQGALDVPNLKMHAAAIGLDATRFIECLDSGKNADRVQADFDEGRKAGVTGTPTFFINGRKLVGAQSFATFQKLVDEELAKPTG